MKTTPSRTEVYVENNFFFGANAKWKPPGDWDLNYVLPSARVSQVVQG